MATRTRRPRQSANGASAGVGAAAREAGDKAVAATRRARGPLVATGAAAAGLAGGLAIGAQRGAKRGGRRRLLAPRRRLLGVPIGPKSGALRTIELVRDAARQLEATTSRATGAAEDVREIREQLEKVNRRSPLEVALDALTHRRGVHRAR